MASDVQISNVRFSAASRRDAARGLLGFVSCMINGALRIDGLTLRRTLDGQFVVAFPARTDARGDKHYIIRPTDNAARLDFEEQILAALPKIGRLHPETPSHAPFSGRDEGSRP